MSRRVVRVVATIGLVAGVLLVGGGPSRAAEVTSGWWWKANAGGSTALPQPVPNQPLPTTAPTPPTPPTADGGVLVGATPDGAFAIAAVRTSEALTSLTLRVATNGDSGGAVAHLLACNAVSRWNPEAGGSWDNKPIVACDLSNGGGSVAGIRSADGATWTFPVLPLATDAGTDVAIVPMSDATLPQGAMAPFQITFVKPTTSDLVLAPKATPAFTSDEFSAPEPTAEFSPSGGGSDLSFIPSLAGGGDITSPLVAPALAAEDQKAPIELRPVSAPLPGSGGQELAGALVVLVSLALFYGTSRQALPPPASLVDVGIERHVTATAEAGGVGRFARPREGSPPALF